MLFLGLLIILNAVLSNTDIVNQDAYRVVIAGMPVNVFDILLALGVVFALVYSRWARFIKTPLHRAMWWMSVLFALAVGAGLIGAMSNGAWMRQILQSGRNLIEAPIAVLVAYFLTGNLKCAHRFLYASVLAGLGAALMIMIHFRSEAEQGLAGKDLLTIRGAMYVSSYAGLAAALLFYSLSTKLRLLPMMLSLMLMGVCFLGQFGTFSRSDWVSCATAMGAAFILMPKEARAQFYPCDDCPADSGDRDLCRNVRRIANHREGCVYQDESSHHDAHSREW